jgi:hypothetical protein
MIFYIETKDPVELEVFRVLKRADGTYADAPDPDNQDLNAPAVLVDSTYAPPVACDDGDFFVIRVRRQA